MAKTRRGVARRNTEAERTATAATRLQPTAPTPLQCYIIPHNNESVKVGDNVLIRSETPNRPYIAQIEGFDNYSASRVDVHLRWYYRPKEAHGGKQDFHGKKELFRSDEIVVRSAATIERKCTVYDEEVYSELEHAEADEYFCRFEYKHATGGFKPDTVDLYCICETPSNPDNPMVACGKCDNWFHIECVGFQTLEEARASNFVCPECSQRGV